MRATILFALAAILTVSVCDTASAERRVALVIGNSAYTNISALGNPKNDAQAMAQALRTSGFEVMTVIDADLLGMSRAIRKFGKSLRAAGRDAVGLFYFAGHGVQSRDANYLVPLGAAIENEADLELEAVSTSTILSQMEIAKNALNLVILDACRNNPFKSTVRSGGRGLARVQAASGTLVAFAAAPGQVAADGTGENSPYTAALVKAIRQPGLSVEDAFKQVRVSVERETGGKQTPWEESSLTGAFQFTPSTDTSPSAARSNAPATAASDVDKEALFWQSIRGSKNPATFKAYLKRYPNGVFAGLAKVRLQELVGAPDAAAPPQGNGPDRRAVVRAIQSELTRHRCDPGAIDGAWGRRSEQALNRFASYSGLKLPSLEPSDLILEQLRSRAARVCPAGCEPGQVLSPSGTCVARAPPAQAPGTIAGNWGYAGVCLLTRPWGTASLQMTGHNRFTGTHSSAQTGISGTIGNGRLSGSQVTYTSRYVFLGKPNVETFSGQLTADGRKIIGSISGGLGNGCQMTLTRR